MNTPTDSERLLRIEEKLTAVLAVQRQMMGLWEQLLVKRPTRAEEARMAGVHPTTISRRRKRLEMRKLVNGNNS